MFQKNSFFTGARLEDREPEDEKIFTCICKYRQLWKKTDVFKVCSCDRLDLVKRPVERYKVDVDQPTALYADSLDVYSPSHLA